ncbi:putative xyloglucan endotransglucosylase/hydrolase protein 30 [Iris pallida]|uniref:Xyloglucan endotransglucosylase/hydrolase n=1 Tax=Iris pallida TaxID=29817 RepID=A0AAX6GPG0_IRIPA|nr:putative xyloglucan endotransglucosylase/hydrolase protein 30 [Iris pallida]
METCLRTHDELDFEFLGNVKGKEWRVQTNVYGNGSTSRGREERYLLPFDPTEEAHRYSILWTADIIIFYIDNIPIREVLRRRHGRGLPVEADGALRHHMGWVDVGHRRRQVQGQLQVLPLGRRVLRPGPPRVPHGAPRAVPLAAEGCADSDAQLEAADFSNLTAGKRAAMQRFRERYMTYSFCYDVERYPATFPDCNVIPSEQEKFWRSGDVKVKLEKTRRRRSKRRSRAVARGEAGKGQQAEV